MTDTRFETSTAVHELLDTMKGLDQGFLSGPKALADDQAVLEGYRWIFSITQVALDVYVWADTNRPRFTEIVGPYKKWGGDNSDAFYFMTRIDPSRTYRVTVDPGDAVYLSLTVYGGPDDGRYSHRIVGTLNTTKMTPNPDGTYEMIVSPNDHDGNFLEAGPRCGGGLHPRLHERPGERGEGPLAHRVPGPGSAMERGAHRRRGGPTLPGRP